MKKMKNKRKSTTLLEFIKQHRIMVTILLTIIMVLIIWIGPLLIFKNVPFYNTDSTKFEIIEHIAQICTSFFVIIGTFVAISQYYISSKSELIKIETDKVNKAIDLADYYKNEVLVPYSVIKYAYKKSGVFEILHSKKNDMKNFDEEEMHEIFNDTVISKLEKNLSSKEFIDSLKTCDEILNLNITGINESEEDKEQRTNTKKVILSFSYYYVTKLLNNMELFAMYFTHNVADESVVYQSLYPTYIEICRTLYYDISKCSKNGNPKLYRNVQKLYTIWLKKMNETKKAVRDQQVNEGTVVESME